MKKSRINVSVDPRVLEKFDQVVENRSGRMEELMRKVVNMEHADESELEKRKEEILDELDEVREEKQEIIEKENSLETELKAVKSSIEKMEEDSGVFDEAVEAISSSYEKHRNKLSASERRNDPDKAFEKMFISETFGMWEEKVSESRSELKQAVKEKVREDYPEHFDTAKKFKKNLEKRVNQDRWEESSDIPDYWARRLDKSKDELWQLKEEVKA